MWRSGCTSRSFPRLLFTSSVTLILCTSRASRLVPRRTSNIDGHHRPCIVAETAEWACMESLLESQCTTVQRNHKVSPGELAIGSAGSKSSLDFHAVGLRRSAERKIANPFQPFRLLPLRRHSKTRMFSTLCFPFFLARFLLIRFQATRKRLTETSSRKISALRTDPNERS